MTADELARLVGATKSQVLAYENGHRVPDPPRIRALAEALGVKPWALMERRRQQEWTVADLRRACGLRAQDVVDALGVSPKNYRRFEAEGIVPARRPTFVDEVAAAFGVKWAHLERALDRLPAVCDRLHRSRELVDELADRYVVPPGDWKGPAATDRALGEIASLYSRPVGRVRRIVSHELAELRQRRVMALRERIIADYDVDSRRRESAHNALDRWRYLYQQELKGLPSRLEAFHRTAQPSDSWQLLVELFNANAVPQGDAPWALATFLDEHNKVLSSRFIMRQTVDGIPVCKLTHAGTRHIQQFGSLYATLYPTSRKPVRPQSGSKSGSRRAAGANVAGSPAVLVQPSKSAENVRLVVPQLGLERYLSGSASRPQYHALSPRHLLIFTTAGSYITTVSSELADPGGQARPQEAG